MLKKLIILIFIFPLYGFDGYQDDIKPSSLPEIVDDWQIESIQKTNSEDKKSKKEKICGTAGSPLKIGAIKNYPPFFWTTETTEIVGGIPNTKYKYNGIFYDYLNNILQSANISYYDIITFEKENDLLKALQRNEIDIAVGIPYFSDSVFDADFIYPAFIANSIVAVFNDKNKTQKIKSFTDLKNIKGVAFSDIESLDEIIKNFETAEENINIVKTNQKENIVYNYLLQNNFDYILTSLYSARTIQSAFNLENKVHFSIPLRQQQLFFIFSLNSKCKNFKQDFTSYIEKENRLLELEKLYNRNKYLWAQENKKSLPVNKKP